MIPAVSYINVFDLARDGPRHALTLEVRDKVIGMDVLGEALAVLVERAEGNGPAVRAQTPGGIVEGLPAERRVDWYDIAVVGRW